MNRLDQLLKKAEVFYQNGDPGHDMAHVKRVMALARRIGHSEGANLEILLPAAILHDVVNLPKNHPERLAASAMAAEKSQMILRECGYSASEITLIAQTIVEHSYSLGKKPSSPESAVLQDADKLDALGAIGTMRAVTCGAKLGSSYYSANEPIAWTETRTRDLNDKEFTIDHFFKKLFNLPDLMNTEMGRREANARVQFMRSFLTQLQNEIEIDPAKSNRSELQAE
jgi:uncharacterized protein